MDAGRKHGLILRWSLWELDAKKVFMLSHSIGTFRAFFGTNARYVVCTDQPELLAANLLAPAEIVSFYMNENQCFLDTRITWRKWAPQPRLDPDAIEIRLDADIFLLDEPAELRAFCNGDSYRMLAALEEFVALWPYGNFGSVLPKGFAPVNAGIIGQHAGVDISGELAELYEAWTRMIQEREHRYHDEQGAVAVLLQERIIRGEVMLLDPTKYRVVCPLNDPPVQSLDGLRLIHATYPDHPSFYQFIREISRVSGLPILPLPWIAV